MPCYHPLRAKRTETGAIQISKNATGPDALSLPCGKCIGCAQAKARDWAIRCHLELQQHTRATFTTLTYDDDNKPPTLSKRHLSLFLKRFRRHNQANGPIRFFACGEYGDQTNRPHYHAIIFGADADASRPALEKSWHLGHIRSLPLKPGGIEYVAGYVPKKYGHEHISTQRQRTDPTTGEVYNYQPPFLQMSRNPGIGGHARVHTQSWRNFAIHAGHKSRVPRFLHEAWKSKATPEQIAELIKEKEEYFKQQTDFRHLAAQEQIALKKQEMTQHQTI